MSTYHAPRGNQSHSGGEQTMFGNIGNDSLTFTGSTPGTLTMFGGTGLDVLTNTGTAVTNEYIYGGTFNSKIYGGNASGTEYLFGHAGSDSIVSGTGNAYISGGLSGNDTISAGAGNDTIIGGTGKDVVTVTDTVAGHHHTLFGGTGAASLSVAGVNNALDNNYLYGGAGNDTLIGSAAGTDLLNPGTGTDVIQGNANAFETLGYGFAGGFVTSAGASSGTVGVTVSVAGSNGLMSTSGNTSSASANWYNVAGGTLQHVGDTIYGVNNVSGSNYADNITMNAGTATVGDHVWTGAGNDTINMGGLSTSAAVTQQNLGNDTVTGGAGNKLFVMHNGTEGTGATTSGDVITGGLGNDTMDFSNVFGNSTLTAANVGVTSTPGYSLNTITGVYVNLSLPVNVGAQTWNANFAGSAGEGTISSVNVIKGTSANDYLVGGGGDTLIGGAGNETLVGGSIGGGHDVLQGNSSSANSTIYDGSSSLVANWFQIGNNSAVSATGTALDNIYGFEELPGDKLYIKTTALGGLSGMSAVAATSASGTTVDNSTWTATYNSALNASGTHNVSTVTLDAAALQNGTVAGGSFSGLAVNTHAEFLFDQGTGNLYYSANGNAAATLATNAAGVVEIAHIDLPSANAFSGAPLVALSTNDFMLVA